MKKLITLEGQAYYDDAYERYCQNATDKDGNDYLVFYNLTEDYEKWEEACNKCMNKGLSEKETRAELDRLELPYVMEEDMACDWSDPVEVYDVENSETYTNIKWAEDNVLEISE